MGLPMASVQVGALMEAMEILVRLLLRFLVQVMVQLVQNDLKLHHGIATVHVLHTGVCILSATQFSLVSSELHPVAYSVYLLLSPTFSFLHLQYELAPALHLSAASLTDVTIALFFVN